MLRVVAKSLWALFSLVGFGLSLVVQIATFFGVSLVDRVPMTSLLHLGMFVAVFPLFFVAVRSARVKGGRGVWHELFRRHPPWVLGLVYALIACAVVNFAVDLISSSGGVPTISDGRPVLVSHGRVIRELSQEEYEHQKVLDARALSSLWLLFYGIPLLYVEFARSEEERGGAT